MVRGHVNADEHQASSDVAGQPEPQVSALDPWQEAARNAAAHRASQTLRLVGAHHGAGTSTWAHLLDAQELEEPPAAGGFVVVARTTIAGVEAAKPFTSRARAVLLVADAPGRVRPEVRRAITVLAGGGAPLVRVPWMPALRGLAEVPDLPTLKKAAAKVAATIDNHWKGTP